jgi:hypothetical protein
MKPKWKVVTRKDRSSIIAKCDGFKKHYEKGQVVNETENSLGIMVFKNRYHAENFLIRAGKIGVGSIVKVMPIGKAKPVRPICDNARNKRRMEKYYRLFNLMEMYIKNGDNESLRKALSIKNTLLLYYGSAPEGTQCYPAVKVLE